MSNGTKYRRKFSYDELKSGKTRCYAYYNGDSASATINCPSKDAAKDNVFRIVFKLNKSPKGEEELTAEEINDPHYSRRFLYYGNVYIPDIIKYSTVTEDGQVEINDYPKTFLSGINEYLLKYYKEDILNDMKTRSNGGQSSNNATGDTGAPIIVCTQPAIEVTGDTGNKTEIDENLYQADGTRTDGSSYQADGTKIDENLDDLGRVLVDILSRKTSDPEDVKQKCFNLIMGKIKDSMDGIELSPEFDLVCEGIIGLIVDTAIDNINDGRPYDENIDILKDKSKVSGEIFDCLKTNSAKLAEVFTKVVMSIKQMNIDNLKDERPNPTTESDKTSDHKALSKLGLDVDKCGKEVMDSITKILAKFGKDSDKGKAMIVEAIEDYVVSHISDSFLGESEPIFESIIDTFTVAVLQSKYNTYIKDKDEVVSFVKSLKDTREKLKEKETKSDTSDKPIDPADLEHPEEDAPETAAVVPEAPVISSTQIPPVDTSVKQEAKQPISQPTQQQQFPLGFDPGFHIPEAEIGAMVPDGNGKYILDPNRLVNGPRGMFDNTPIMPIGSNIQQQMYINPQQPMPMTQPIYQQPPVQPTPMVQQPTVIDIPLSDFNKDIEADYPELRDIEKLFNYIKMGIHFEKEPNGLIIGYYENKENAVIMLDLDGLVFRPEPKAWPMAGPYDTVDFRQCYHIDHKSIVAIRDNKLENAKLCVGEGIASINRVVDVRTLFSFIDFDKDEEKVKLIIQEIRKKTTTTNGKLRKEYQKTRYKFEDVTPTVDGKFTVKLVAPKDYPKCVGGPLVNSGATSDVILDISFPKDDKADSK